jgi:hypothetical protein
MVIFYQKVVCFHYESKGVFDNPQIWLEVLRFVEYTQLNLCREQPKTQIRTGKQKNKRTTTTGDTRGRVYKTKSGRLSASRFG